MTSARTIGVVTPSNASVPRSLLAALADLIPVEFVAADEHGIPECDGAILFGCSEEEVAHRCSKAVRSLAFIDRDARVVPNSAADVHLTATKHLHECFRGRTLPDRTIDEVFKLQRLPGDLVIARKGDDVVWIRRPAGQSAVDLVAVAPPVLRDNEFLYSHFQRDDWVRLLPLLHFVAEISGWTRPRLRACFMFDDPNLRWKSYGYLRYRELTSHAKKHNYHVSIATIPLDSWYVHPETVGLFRDNPKHLSLVVHGNNHTHSELARNYSEVVRDGLAAQAVRRIRRLEQLSGLHIPPIMTAPHGACNDDMAASLLRAGFNAACISRSSLIVRNPTKIWSRVVGLTPAEFLSAGLPILPRFNLRWDFTQALFAGFLGQPLILIGHHDDLSDGLGLLEDWVRFLDSAGVVEWTDVKAMAETNFCHWRRDEVLNVHMYSRQIALTVPPGCLELRVCRPWLADGQAEDLRVCQQERVDVVSALKHHAIAVLPGKQVTVESIWSPLLDVSTVHMTRPALSAIIRRQACEARDRLRPLTDWILDRRRVPSPQPERILERRA